MGEFVRACALDQLPEPGTFGVELNGTPVVLVRSEGEVYALDEFCTHEEVSLVDGEVYDHTVECWLHGSCFDVRSGKPTGPHAIMGPNGSGKSTLAYSIAGHPKYHVTSGTVTLDGEDVLAMSVDARARAGLFLAMQYPVEVPGVTVSNFLRTAVTAVRGEAPRLRE